MTQLEDKLAVSEQKVAEQAELLETHGNARGGRRRSRRGDRRLPEPSRRGRLRVRVVRLQREQPGRPDLRAGVRPVQSGPQHLQPGRGGHRAVDARVRAGPGRLPARHQLRPERPDPRRLLQRRRRAVRRRQRGRDRADERPVQLGRDPVQGRQVRHAARLRSDRHRCEQAGHAGRAVHLRDPALPHRSACLGQADESSAGRPGSPTAGTTPTTRTTTRACSGSSTSPTRPFSTAFTTYYGSDGNTGFASLENSTEHNNESSSLVLDWTATVKATDAFTIWWEANWSRQKDVVFLDTDSPGPFDGRTLNAQWYGGLLRTSVAR